MKISASELFAWIWVFGLILHNISFSGADGVATDELSLFNEDTDPLPSTYLLDPTDSYLILDMDFNDENTDEFDMFLNDPDSNLFASDVDLDSLVDATPVTDCGLINDGYFREKARVRRQISCRNPAYSPNPNLSLPSLDQISPSEANREPWRPKTNHEKAQADLDNLFSAWGGVLFRGIDLYLKRCRSGEQMICSSEYVNDIQLESNKQTYTVKYSTTSKLSPRIRRFQSPLCKNMKRC